MMRNRGALAPSALKARRKWTPADACAGTRSTTEPLFVEGSMDKPGRSDQKRGGHGSNLPTNVTPLEAPGARATGRRWSRTGTAARATPWRTTIRANTADATRAQGIPCDKGRGAIR